MGVFSVPITVSNQTTGASADVHALVDTAATLPVISTSVLQSLGIEPVGQRVFEYADGRKAELRVGKVDITVEGQTTQTLVVFGPDDVDQILGSVVFELLGMTIDPANSKLIPAPGLIY